MEKDKKNAEKSEYLIKTDRKNEVGYTNEIKKHNVWKKNKFWRVINDVPWKKYLDDK